jgi:UDP-N-acetylmuramoyl-tripeptide--D-alanyl-D-alanine ligase
MSAPLAKTLKQKLPNDYAIQNATLAFSVAKSLGLKESEVLAAADKLSLPEGRGNVETLSSETVLIADHYNSNPSSLRAGLASAEQMARRANKKLVLILGDMLDLGTASAEAHLKLFDEIRQVKFSKLIFVGPEWKKAMLARNLSDCEWYENSQVAAQTLKGVSFAQSVILLKGSRGMALEHVLKELKSV